MAGKGWKSGYGITILLLLLIPLALVIYKTSVLGYSFRNILPLTGYDVTLEMRVNGYGEETSFSTWLPISNERQLISDVQQETGFFQVDISSSEQGQQAEWTNLNAEGEMKVRYSMSVLPKATAYELDSDLVIPAAFPPTIMPFLEPTSGIQSNHPQITDACSAIVQGEERMVKVLEKLYTTILEYPNKAFKGYTDALTTLKLQEGSCNGKSRLFAAFCRNQGIPARLSGGLILETGNKRTSHQWVELYINGFWVPFDMVNDHFAALPSNYLELYKGDEVLFKHTSNTGFDFQYFIEKRMESNPLLQKELGGDAFNSYKMWNAFQSAGIPLSLLKVILLMPLGAMVVAICRNVIGLKTFGVFLPALIAVAAGYTGLWWGLLAFFLVIAVVSLMHFPLERVGILYTPKLVVMLVSVVVTFIILSIIGIYLDYSRLAFITLFPVVVITITAERFARMIMEEGYPRALNVTVQTLVVVLIAFLAMNSRTMEAVFLAFPELFLVIIAFMLLLGRWLGMRVSEYRRFKSLIG